MWRIWGRSTHRFDEEQRLLRALANGDTLKAHRQLDGAKRYRLHPLDGGAPSDASPEVVERLLARGLLASNFKFPAAVLLLTKQGAAVAAALSAPGPCPVGSLM